MPFYFGVYGQPLLKKPRGTLANHFLPEKKTSTSKCNYGCLFDVFLASESGWVRRVAFNCATFPIISHAIYQDNVNQSTSASNYGYND